MNQRRQLTFRRSIFATYPRANQHTADAVQRVHFVLSGRFYSTLLEDWQAISSPGASAIVWG